MSKSEMDRGNFVSRVEAESTTLLTCIERYMREVSVHKRGTQELCLDKAWKATPLATRVMASIRGSDLAALRVTWLKKLKPATVLRRLAFISHVFSVVR